MKNDCSYSVFVERDLRSKGDEHFDSVIKLLGSTSYYSAPATSTRQIKKNYVPKINCDVDGAAVSGVLDEADFAHKLAKTLNIPDEKPAQVESKDENNNIVMKDVDSKTYKNPSHFFSGDQPLDPGFAACKVDV